MVMVEPGSYLGKDLAVRGPICVTLEILTLQHLSEHMKYGGTSAGFLGTCTLLLVLVTSGPLRERLSVGK